MRAHVNATGSSTASNPPRGIPVTFKDVFADEIECISDSRRLRKIPADPSETSLIGLAFSGGGIRSATFNLGILQALAENRLLHKFDYLSTVSGGGYIGSWLAALTRRFAAEVPGSSFEDVEKALVPAKYESDKRNESTFFHWLRLYSNYLTPHTGVISGDTWAMLGTWLRNVFLNQTILSLLFVSVFVFCHGTLLSLVRNDEHASEFFAWAGVLLFLAAVFMALNVVEQVPSRDVLKSRFQRIKITLEVMLPFVVASVLLNCGLWNWLDLEKSPIWQWAVAGAGFYLLAWGVVALMAALRRLVRKRGSKPQKPMISIRAVLIFSPIAGAVGACLLKEYNLLLNHLPAWTSTNWVVIVFGTGVIMLVLLITGSLHIGLVGRGSRDLVREWWARLGGDLVLVTVGWLLLAGTCAFGPLAVRWGLFKLRGWGSLTALLLWVAHNVVGLRAASSARTVGTNNKGLEAGNVPGESGSEPPTGLTASVLESLKSPRLLRALANVAPYVFAVGLVLILSTAVHIGTGLLFDTPDTNQLWYSTLSYGSSDWTSLSETYWSIEEAATVPPLLMAGLLLLLAGLALSWRVDVNDFSLHHFYRNRLVRCYLGASNPNREPQLFTGFDPADDVPLKDFAAGYPGPYPILNAALNITAGEELGYATRRAKSFVFTPRYCGYDAGTTGTGQERFKRDNGYLPSFSPTATARSRVGLTAASSDDGITLGTAMAISGAAASPNMGYFTSSATAFFMTLFDVRLGWWMGNPRYQEKWPSPGPRLGITYLISELLAQSDEKKGYVYLSDGGHFENLAVYELIKRRCQLIVACDADCDRGYVFENLLSLIEKARTDFGAKIVINFDEIRPQSGRESVKNFVVGKILYDPNNPGDPASWGKLIYIKTSMPLRRVPSTGTPQEAQKQKEEQKQKGLPDDVWQYYELHGAFPHQSTADQWFDELQFESYRALGEYLGNLASKEIGGEMDRILGGPLRAAEARIGQ